MDRRRPSPHSLGLGALALIFAIGCAQTDGTPGSGSGGAPATGGTGQTSGNG